jgi:hypothetical protein
MEAQVRPLVFGYLRVWAADPSEVGVRLTTEMHAFAEREGLMLADVYSDRFDPPADHPDRSGFCALMDALRRHEASGVLIPSPEHLARMPRSYQTRRTIIETEAGARILVVHSAGERP